MNSDNAIQLIECPRDAMQGWEQPIRTADKIRYLNSLLKVGFHTLDFGSFVSPKAIPQMADTAAVLDQLDLSDTHTKLLAIVANIRGAESALLYPQIDYLGFPFSLSPTFQLRNTNSTMAESFDRVKAIQEKCVAKSKHLVVYLSMGFGNPYGDPYNTEILLQWADAMVQEGIGIISLADTVGLATPEQVRFAISTLQPQYPSTTIGVHLHATANDWELKLSKAWEAGCRRFDGALKGIGGCPMAQNELVGNMDTEKMIPFFEQYGALDGLNKSALANSSAIAGSIFHV